MIDIFEKLGKGLDEFMILLFVAFVFDSDGLCVVGLDMFFDSWLDGLCDEGVLPLEEGDLFVEGSE